MSDHWLDRFAARSTRRDTFKVAAAGAAALTLPAFLRPGRAAAAEDCTRGCLWTENRKYNSSRRACEQYTNASIADGLGIIFWPALAAPFANSAAKELTKLVYCVDNAILKDKYDQYECSKPGCGFFNPYDAGGPCEGCQPPYSCCPCPTIESGYICCAFACGDKEHDCCPR